jgi:Squalene-hopene cyclase C-terminal domain/Prenyltransferase and squalene oxidase repeat
MPRAIVSALVCLLASGCARHTDNALRRGCEYLWSQQAADGGWHSGTYGLLKSGQSLSGFVFNALLQVPEQVCQPPAGARDRAIAFLKHNTNSEGAVGKMDPLLYDYPNYATALAVRALRRAGQPVGEMVRWLRTQQFTEDHGWKRADPPYGAWGMGGDARTAPNPGHVDLSMTRHVLQALAAAGLPQSDPAFARARVFVERCQNPDGGFFFSTVVLDANKAGQDGEQYRSYGTATADGILALLAMGTPRENSRVRAAERWLAAHDRPDGAPGFVGPAYQRWTAGLRFYYAAVSAQVFAAPNQKLAASLEAAQRSDGSWRNAENLVKEDDPLIATGFAVMALTQAIATTPPPSPRSPGQDAR